MAILKFFPVIPSGTNATANGQTITLATTVSSSPITIGSNVLIRITTDQPVYIRFGNSGTTTATTADVYCPANFPEIFDMGRWNTTIVINNTSASTAHVNIVTVAKG